jgi:hypothetical protein
LYNELYLKEVQFMENHDLNNFERAWLLEEDEETCDPGIRHDPSEIMQRNAAFLLESSRKISSYDQSTLMRMQTAFDVGNYSRVIELAYEHDRTRRQGRHLFSTPSSARTPLTRVRQFVANIISFLSN